ncbi:HAD family acid phosphatase [Mycoplasma simbae]|uniref:HAD family acid phosphatase n=1 Tax=Mycoplasma simbae TaxID=36744 RepID=UPI0004978FB3|nr:HAD family acid phosphatase [Mycoplasma simbae]
MSKKYKFLLSSLVTMASMPMLAAACTNDQKVRSEAEQKEYLETEIKKLKKSDQLALIDKLFTDADQKAELISKLNSGAGIVSAIVWYMKSAEQRMASLQAYALATAAFDNLKLKAENDNIEYDKVNKETGIVSNPTEGKAIPVVFMDIDETVFMNEYTESWTVVKNNGKFSEDLKDSVDAKGQRRAIPGAIEFIKHVFENGGVVLFNSGIRQLESSIQGIKKNLIAAGLPEKYVHDWMFWCSGVIPVDKDGQFSDKTPWKTAIEAFKNTEDSSERKKLAKATSKNQRMNAVSDNTAGWNFGASQTGSGDKIVAKVIMKIGDDFNDFYDDAYKPLESNDKNVEFSKNEKIQKLFTDYKGAQGVKVTATYQTNESGYVTGVNANIQDLSWHQFNVQVPGNAMYGGWQKEFSYGSYKKLWEALKQINANSNDAKESTTTGQ